MYFTVTIQPEWEQDTVSALNIRIRTDRGVKAGEDVAARMLELVTIPFCPMDAPVFTDALGVLETEPYAGETEMSFVHREFYKALRDTEGEITIAYRVTPRIQPEGYRSSPYFDLVAEKGGVLGTGTTFLLHTPGLSETASFTLRWDLARLPEGCRGIWSLGAENTASKTDISVSDILFSAYMVGKVHAVEDGPAGFYWFDRMPIDANEGARQITMLFNHMSEMFRDKGGDYRVFARHNHFPGGGGTALTRSYIYGYGLQDEVTIEGLQSLLTHEMVHNWPTMTDHPAGLGTWYVEGSAEYYSVLVPMEMGICSPEKTAADINDKAGNYYTNPMNRLSNLELGKLYWTDRHCQWLPYARGILYLSNLDAAIQRSTGNRHTLLDIELALLQIDNPTPEDFLRIGSEIAGFDLRPGYEAICRGDRIEPDPDAFGGRFTVTETMVRLNNAQHRGEQ